MKITSGGGWRLGAAVAVLGVQKYYIEQHRNRV